MRRILLIGWLALAILPATASEPGNDARLAQSVDQLRHVIGRWAVVTRYLREDGSVALAVDGIYDFHWVIPDRVASGVSDVPQRKQRAGILLPAKIASEGSSTCTTG